MMTGPIQAGSKRSKRFADELLRDAGSVEETPDLELWDAPGHDGVITDEETDLDRTDLRSEIGRYVSLVAFPARTHTMVATAEREDASDAVLTRLRSLDRDARFEHPGDVWDALGLSAGRRS